MKKLLVFALTTLLVLSLSACGMNSGSNMDNSQSGERNSTVSETVFDTNVSSDSAEKSITREEAIEIALNHAGFKESEVINLTAELDSDLSHSEWEVEFDKDNYEFSYEINPVSGEIIKSEKEID